MAEQVTVGGQDAIMEACACGGSVGWAFDAAKECVWFVHLGPASRLPGFERRRMTRKLPLADVPGGRDAGREWVANSITGFALGVHDAQRREALAAASQEAAMMRDEPTVGALLSAYGVVSEPGEAMPYNERKCGCGGKLVWWQEYQPVLRVCAEHTDRDGWVDSRTWPGKSDDLNGDGMRRRLAEYTGELHSSMAREAIASGGTTMSATNPIRGKDICVTGKVEPWTRDEVGRQIALAGGRMVDSVRPGTAILVMGDLGQRKSTEKLSAARRMGLPVWSDNELRRALVAANQPAPARATTTTTVAPSARARGSESVQINAGASPSQVVRALGDLGVNVVVNPSRAQYDALVRGDPGALAAAEADSQQQQQWGDDLAPRLTDADREALRLAIMGGGSTAKGLALDEDPTAIPASKARLAGLPKAADLQIYDTPDQIPYPSEVDYDTEGVVWIIRAGVKIGRMAKKLPVGNADAMREAGKAVNETRARRAAAPPPVVTRRRPSLLDRERELRGERG